MNNCKTSGRNRTPCSTDTVTLATPTSSETKESLVVIPMTITGEIMIQGGMRSTCRLREGGGGVWGEGEMEDYSPL